MLWRGQPAACRYPGLAEDPTSPSRCGSPTCKQRADCGIPRLIWSCAVCRIGEQGSVSGPCCGQQGRQSVTPLILTCARPVRPSTYMVAVLRSLGTPPRVHGPADAVAVFP